VVDDEKDIAITLKEILEETGSFEVKTYTDPVLALSEFNAGTYDLAVLDIRMPVMNGFELCIKLREIDDRLRMCFLTAADLLYYHETDPDIIRGLGKGCFVPKPVNNEYFLEKIEAILS
jgi:DNA-binding response OmpR family regulator